MAFCGGVCQSDAERPSATRSRVLKSVLTVNLPSDTAPRQSGVARLGDILPAPLRGFAFWRWPEGRLHRRRRGEEQKRFVGFRATPQAVIVARRSGTVMRSAAATRSVLFSRGITRPVCRRRIPVECCIPSICPHDQADGEVTSRPFSLSVADLRGSPENSSQR